MATDCDWFAASRLSKTAKTIETANPGWRTLMDNDERDPDLCREVIDERRKRAAERRRATTWDEPPEFYDDE